MGFFAPRVETALSGAGWETTGSQSVQARQLIDKNFHGLSSNGLMTVVHSPTQTVGDPAFSSVVARVERMVIGVVLGLGFLLLLIALQAPLLAAVGVLTNLLATGAAFGVAKWIFQDGALHSLLGFQSQGFLDAWGPVFFFAMIFAISMDYTVFLLSSAKEHWDRTHDPREAMIGGIAHSGRVIFAAGARDGRRRRFGHA